LLITANRLYIYIYIYLFIYLLKKKRLGTGEQQCPKRCRFLDYINTYFHFSV